MTPAIPLADIHTPQAITLWPPAYGWWLLMVLTLVVIISLSYLYYRNYQTKLAKKSALKALNNIKLNEANAVQQINAVLKRGAIHYYGREAVAILAGDSWQHFLINTLPKRYQAKGLTLHQHPISYGYEPQTDKQQVIVFHQFAQLWLHRALPGKGFTSDLIQPQQPKSAVNEVTAS